MRFARHAVLTAAAAVAAAAGYAQVPASSPKPPVGMAGGTLVTPPETAGYVATFSFEASAPTLKPPATAAAEAKAVLGTLKAPKKVAARAYLTQDLSRLEILSDGFVLPAGAVVLHRAGDKAYVLADPQSKTYAIMDAEPLLDALEGGAGILHTQYSATVQHTDERKTIAGVPARKSLVTVAYVASIPLESSRILVQEKNDVEIWHSSGFSSAAALDHFFFKFQRDRTGEVRRAMAQDIGFPMEVTMVVTPSATAKKANTMQSGSLHAVVTDLKKEAKLDSAIFRIPPADYRRVDRLPWFGAARPAGAN
jgi:hypothetical protein